MNDVKMMGSLLDRLLSYVSSAPERDANYDIAVALLRNYSQLKGLARFWVMISILHPLDRIALQMSGYRVR